MSSKWAKFHPTNRSNVYYSQTRRQYFAAEGPKLTWHLGYAVSRQSYLVKASDCGPQKTAPWAPRGGEGPVWENLK